MFVFNFRPAFLGNATLYESLHESCSIINNPSNACLAIPNGFNISYSQEGDIVLGGLLPVHMGIACSTLEDMGTIQRLEAVAFAVNDVNGNPSYLKVCLCQPETYFYTLLFQIIFIADLGHICLLG